uniref:Reverse transcriptase domain-containing protein n=1 Tax=Echeneis naucrates TaxID=173247 RepID=A0A665TEM0_ECHNA
MLSAPFQLWRSTRQDCLLSLLLFILAIELLACAIRQDKDITGIFIGGYDFQLNMYVDDILLTLSKPSHSIPKVLETMNLFGKLSGYKINWTKSEIRRYDIFGHIGLKLLKMNVLPRLNFLMLSIPLFIEKSWFDSVNKMFSSFLWNNKMPRFNWKKLSLPRDKGGLGIPDLYSYYLSFNARYSITWGYKKMRNKLVSGIPLKSNYCLMLVPNYL